MRLKIPRTYKKLKKLKDICPECGEEYFYKKRKRKYHACRRCLMKLSKLRREAEAKEKGICITCFRRKVYIIKCPHCKKDILKSPRCKQCIKNNGAWYLRKRAKDRRKR